MDTLILAEVFPVGEILADELDERGWSQSEFADILGRPTQFVSEIVSGKKEITRESAAQIGAALGTSAEMWLNLQDSYFLWKQGQDEATQANLRSVKTRAELRSLAPVSLLIKRGYIKSEDAESQTREVLQLYGKESFDDPSSIRFAARRSNCDEEVTGLQDAWVACVRANAQSLNVESYSKAALEELAQTISQRAADPAAFAEFQDLFAQVGVKLIYVESFPGGKLDGCAFMLDNVPTIGISGRGKRLDKVLFTLLHEISHILLSHVSSDGSAIVDDLSIEGNGQEREADRKAGELIIPGDLTPIPDRIGSAWVEAQSQNLGVHPIVIVGRLQKQGSLSWKSTLARNAPAVTEYLEQWKAPFLMKNKSN